MLSLKFKRKRQRNRARERGNEKRIGVRGFSNLIQGIMDFEVVQPLKLSALDSAADLKKTLGVGRI